MRRDVIVIGASAGGVEALQNVVAGLPPDLSAAVLIVLHVPARGGSVLPAILSRSGSLRARHPVSGELLPRGEILVAPPDRHLALTDGRVVLTRGPRENGIRPAADVLFRTAARAWGPRVIGVVLSGVLDDGTAGLVTVASQGGVTVVQDPDEALYGGMPRSVLSHLEVDHVVPSKEIADLLVRLCAEDVPEDYRPSPPLLDAEVDLALMDEREMNADERPGTPSGFSCPDCHGVLWEIRDGSLLRYRCRVGHAWSDEGLLGQQTERLDSALWMALRGLEEKSALARVLADRAAERGHAHTESLFREQADDATQAASVLRDLLVRGIGRTTDEERV